MSVMVEMTKEDANNLDEVVRELGIGESFTTPAEAVRNLKSENERLQAALCIFASRANWKQDSKAFPVEWAGVGSTPWEIATKALGLNALTEAQ